MIANACPAYLLCIALPHSHPTVPPGSHKIRMVDNGIREEQINFCTPFSFMCHQYMRILQGGRGHGQVATGVSEY